MLARWLLIVGLATSSVALMLAASLPARRYFFLIYMAPLFLTGPVWLRLRLAELTSVSGSELAVDLGVFLVAALRTFGGWGVLPYSGHTLFLSYSLLTTRGVWYRTLAGALLLMTTTYKLAVWHDPSSWLWGLGLGVAAGGVRQLVGRRTAVA